MTCPVCHSEQRTAGGECAACGSDLSLLGALDNLALRYYNEALNLARDEATIDEAIEKLRLATALDARHAPSFVVLGKLEAQKGKYEEAIAAFRRALELAPEGEEAHEKARKGLEKAEQLLGRQRAEQEDARQRSLQAENNRRRRRGLLAAAAVLCGFVIGLGAARMGLRQGPAPAADSGQRAEQLASVVRGVLSSLPSVLDPHVGGAKGRDLMDALSAAKVTVAPAADGRLELKGTAPVPEVKQLLERIASAAAGPDGVQASGVEVKDEYVEYVIRPGDCPERIARRLCGTRRRLEEIRNFSAENRQTLERMRIGSVLKIPKRLLANPNRG